MMTGFATQSNHSTVSAANQNDADSFARFQITEAIAEAKQFRDIFLADTVADVESGLKNKSKPDWAMTLLRKKSVPVPVAVMEKIGARTLVKRRPSEPAPYLAYVQKCFDHAAPLVFRIPVGPIKNMNCAGTRQSPDLAEYLGFIQLARVMHAVSALYPHGVKVELVPDDVRARAANLCPDCYVHCYITGLRVMVETLGFSKWLQVENGQTRLYERYKTDHYRDQAIEKLELLKQNDPAAFESRMGSAVENARKNYVVRDLDNAEAEVADSAWRYMVAHQSEILSGMWSVGDIFPMVYANHPNNYQLFTMGYNKTKLPWQIELPFHLVSDEVISFSDLCVPGR